LQGLSFRNYGEMAKTSPRPPKATFLEIFNDHRNKTGKISFEHDIQIETLRRYSCPDSPGWNMRIPDAIRADVFLKEFEGYEKRGDWPNLVIIFLPSNHTSGTSPGAPTPRRKWRTTTLRWAGSWSASPAADSGRRPAFSPSKTIPRRF